MQDKRLNVAVLLKIGEEKGEDTITQKIYNEEGEVTGLKNEEQWEAECASVEGKRVVFVEAQCLGKTARYQSTPVDNDDKSIANALANVLVNISGSLARQFRLEQKEKSSIIQLN